MNDHLTLFDSMGNTIQAYSPYYSDQVSDLFGEGGSQRYWYAMQIARGIDPELLTPGGFEIYYAFSTEEKRRERLEEIADAGLFSGNLRDGYRLAERGRDLIERVYETAQAAISVAPALPTTDSGRLVNYLRRLVKATRESVEPKLKPSLRASLWTHPRPGSVDAALIDQYVTDLSRFRDDAHSAAWRTYGVSGPTWDLLTMIWSEDSIDLQQLIEKATDKGYDQPTIEGGLTTLNKLGWLAISEDIYSLSADGRQIRDAAEDTTNRIFFAPWQVLSNTERDDLRQLLSQLQRELAQGRPQPEAA